MTENAVDPANFAFAGQFSQGLTPTNESGGVGYIPVIPNEVFSVSAEGGLTYLEQVVAIHCKNVPYMVGKNEQKKVAVLFRPRCKLWSCPSCRKTNSALWCVRAALGAQSLLADVGHLSLVTVTAHERLSREFAIRVFPHNWDMLRKRWRRESGKAAYLIVPEIGNHSGHFHVHLITNNSPDTSWWKTNAREVGLGYQAKESRSFDNPHHAGFYVAKYLKKQFDRDQFVKGFHRVRTSNGWPKLPTLERDENWKFEIVGKNTSLESVQLRLLALGYNVAMADHKSAWSVVDAC